MVLDRVRYEKLNDRKKRDVIENLYLVVGVDHPEDILLSDYEIDKLCPCKLRYIEEALDRLAL